MRDKNIAGKYPTLITERLCLRPLVIQDVPDIFEYASVPKITTYTVWYPHEKLQDSQMFVQSILHWYEKEKRIIGTCGFIDYDENHNKAELAYALS